MVVDEMAGLEVEDHHIDCFYEEAVAEDKSCLHSDVHAALSGLGVAKDTDNIHKLQLPTVYLSEYKAEFVFVSAVATSVFSRYCA